MTLAVCAVVVVFLLSNAIIEATLHPHHMHPEGSLLLFDMAGISKFAQVNVVPGDRSPELNRRLVEECYQPLTWDYIWVKCDPIIQDLRSTGAWDHLLLPWATAVKAHPQAYLEHRLAHVSTYFYTVYLTFVVDPTKTTIESGFNNNLLHRMLQGYVLFAARVSPLWLFFTNGFWLVTSALLLVGNAIVWLRTKGSNYLAFGITASAAFYVWPLTLVGVAHDFRYSYWGVGATCIGALALFDLLLRRREKDRPHKEQDGPA